MSHLHDGIPRRGWKTVHIRRKGRLTDLEPGCTGCQVVTQLSSSARQGRGHREATVAHHFRGHALADLAFCLRVQRQRKIGVRVNVNEARGHYLSRGINDALCRTSERARYGPHAPIAHGNIETLAGRPTAIDDLSTANDEVVHRVSPLVAVWMHRLCVARSGPRHRRDAI